TVNDSDFLVAYEGCCCAGGLVTTIEGENIVESDYQGQNPTTLGRRKQKVYEDILGRTSKTEVLNWNGTIYSTNTVQFNGRDQALSVTQTEQSTSVSQITSMTYDGHGRLKTQHRPEQDTNTATTYNYNIDNSIQSVVDARGASTNYVYNDPRGLVTQVNYTSPDATLIPVTPTANFTYDNIGNRITMTDGLGNAAYAYNELSQMVSETRQFVDNSTTPPLSLPDAPLPGNSFKLEYEYTLSGGLKSLKDPYGQQFNYAFDRTGRLNSVTGATAFAGISNYASNPQYRAWGDLKNLTYGNGLQMAQTFDNRLQTASYSLTAASGSWMQKNYQYYPDGSLKYVQDQLDAKFDRMNTYDHAGRIKEGKSGAEARGQTPDSLANVPYRQSYQFNEFDNLTQRIHMNWGVTSSRGRDFDKNYTYQNNRVIGQSHYVWLYDADGRNTNSNYPDDNTSSTFDAAGRLTRIYESTAQVETKRVFDGAGQELKSTALYGSGPEGVKYYIRSSVLRGEIISEADTTGKKTKTVVHAAGTVLARQTYHAGTQIEKIEFEQWDASRMSYRQTFNNAGTVGPIDGTSEKGETDPTGNGVGMDGNIYVEENQPPDRDFPLRQIRSPGDIAMFPDGRRMTCTQDGIPMSCAMVQRNLQNGVSAQCPNNECGAISTPFRGRQVLTLPFTAYADGHSGYIPVGGRYQGNGRWSW
ncbi:MAG: hypothetical protein H0U23_01045, partial [Blastocatellia bacterium]|nr:hypothetical protein [Blastocatellia bacterium]